MTSGRPSFAPRSSPSRACTGAASVHPSATAAMNPFAMHRTVMCSSRFVRRKKGNEARAPCPWQYHAKNTLAPTAAIVVVAFVGRLPAGDLEDDAVARDVVLDADEEAPAPGVEDAAGPFRGEVVERADAHAAVGEAIVVRAVLEARPQVVVASHLRAVAVLVEDPVAAAGLVGDVVHHRLLGCAD